MILHTWFSIPVHVPDGDSGGGTGWQFSIAQKGPETLILRSPRAHQIKAPNDRETFENNQAD